MTSELTRYDAMRAAIADCHRVDEAAQIADQAAAYAAYARQAHDTEMWTWCMEIKVRAEYQIGVLMEAQKASSQGMNKGGRPKARTGSDADPVSEPPKPSTLAEAGIDKHLADKSRKRAAKGKDQLEADIAALKSSATKSVSKKRSAQARAPGQRRLTGAERHVRTENFRDALRGLTKGLAHASDRFSRGRHIRLIEDYLRNKRLDDTDLAIIGQLRAEIERLSKAVGTLDELLRRRETITPIEDSPAAAEPETVH